ncbi:MAG: nucleotide exchange factor GrpE [Acidobacteria bacterium]|nr:MAG: nucleotide exchange factor GrpE [Acidobacteriota bacterium]
MSNEHDISVKVIDRRRWAQEKEAGASAATSQASLKPTYVEELERQLAEKDRQLQDTLTKYRQASHEFDEARARMRKEIARDAERSRRDVLAGLLDIVDNLERAIDAARRAGTAEVLLQGVELVRQQFLSKLEGLGVKPIEANGRPFDPLVHEAVTTVPAADASQDGLVVGVVRPGYRIGDDVLRPALVAVAKAMTSAAP